MPETPREALGPTVHETIVIGERTLVIGRPDGVDRLSDHPTLGAASAADEYMPYWASLWPSARLLATIVLREPWPAAETGEPLTALEIGCGLGLPGIAALSRGLRVIFSDYDAAALTFAADNARLNGFADFNVLHMDWRRPPENLRVPVLLASDLIYQECMAQPLAACIKQLLSPGGCCFLIDRDRIPARTLQGSLHAEGLAFTMEEPRMEDAREEVNRATLYRILCN